MKRKLSEILNEEELRLFNLCIPFKDLESKKYENHIWTKEEMFDLVNNEIKESKKLHKEMIERFKENKESKELTENDEKLMNQYFENGNEYIRKLNNLRNRISLI